MADRTCIVTRQVADPADLIRFVAGPDGSVVPDLKGKLPGRGTWVGLHRPLVERAVARGLFARALKAQVSVPEGLAQQVDDLLQRAALDALGFARKAGQCVTGAGKAESAIRSGRAIGLLHATDAAGDGIRKLRQAITATVHLGAADVPVMNEFTVGQMNLALGGTNVIHAALLAGGAAQSCLHKIARLAAYRGHGRGRDEESEFSRA